MNKYKLFFDSLYNIFDIDVDPTWPHFSLRLTCLTLISNILHLILSPLLHAKQTYPLLGKGIAEGVPHHNSGTSCWRFSCGAGTFVTSLSDEISVACFGFRWRRCSHRVGSLGFLAHPHTHTHTWWGDGFEVRETFHFRFAVGKSALQFGNNWIF